MNTQRTWARLRVWTFGGALCAAVMLALLPMQPAHAQTDEYARAGWTATLSTNAHGVSGTAQIIDARTVRLTNFNYDGGGPLVYAYLGATDDNDAFADGVVIGGLLTRPEAPYVNETVDLVLPDGLSLDGYDAISIWCVEFSVNFGSGTFAPDAGSDEQRVYLPLLRAGG